MKSVTNAFVLWLAFSCLMIIAIILVAPNYLHTTFLPDQGANWYYWQLPEVSQIARITGWTLFVAHLVTTLLLVSKVQKEKSSDTFTFWQQLLLLSQAVFVVLHLLQTYFWYDSLVKDTPVWLSQVSVIIMLVLMLGILNQKRGLFFGKKIPIPEFITQAFISFHGYFIIVATIFTFWYHPMEATIGHLIGFFYMFLLFGQIIFSNTKLHFARLWVFILELTVLIHGTAIAMQSVTIPSVNPTKILWPMFAFGFGAIVVITQIYYLQLPKLVNHLLTLTYVLLVVFIYSGAFLSIRNFSQLYEISFIPFIEYALVFVFAGIAWLLYKLKFKFTSAT